MQNQNKITQAKPVLGSGRNALRGGVIADQQERDIVGLACTARKSLNRIEYRLLEMIQGRVTAAGKGVPQARDAEQFVIGVGSFGNSITEENKSVVRLQFHASGFVFHARDEPDRSGTFCKRFGKFPTAKKQWRGMSGIDVLEFPITAENTKKHGGVFAYFRMLAQEIIDVIKNSRRIGAHGHAGKRALEHRREQGCAESLAGNVRDQEGSAVIAHRKYVEVVATDGETRKINTAHGKMRVIAKTTREKSLLNVACDGEFLLETLTLAFILDQAGIIQNAGGFDGERVQDLAFEFGKSGHATGIQIDDAQKMF